MVTKKKPSPYDCIKGSPILERGEKLVPFACFDESVNLPRNWNEIAKEIDIIKKKYGMVFPEFDQRKKGYNWVYTRKEGKKRVWIE